MKTIKSLIMIVLVAVAAISVQAKGLQEAGTNILLSKGSTAKEAVIRVANLPASSESLRFYIIDEEGNVLYRESLKDQKGYAKRFDFGQIPQGSYSLKVGNSSEYIEKDLKVTDEGFEVKQTESIAAKVQPYVIAEGSQAKVLVKNDLDETLELTLYSEQGLLYKDKVEAKKSYGKLFNFSKSEATGHYLVIKGEDFKYTKTIQ